MEAVAAMTVCCALSDDAEDWHVYGHCLQMVGRADEGLAALQRAIRAYEARGPQPDALFWKAAAMARAGATDDALAALAEAVGAAPRLGHDAWNEHDFEGLRTSEATPARFRAACGEG